MVPACSHKVSRVSWYSGYRLVSSSFMYGAFTLFGRLSQNLSIKLTESIPRSEPRHARTPVWPLSISLAATLEITCCFLFLRLLRCFSSPGSLRKTMDSSYVDGAFPPPGFPIRISMALRSFAAPHGFSQLTTSFVGSWCQGIHPVLFLA